MSAEELRSFVQEALEQLDDRPRTALVDALIARAAKGNSGWKPSLPASEIIREVETFTAAVRRIGSAAPEQIDDYLRQGMKAFLGGDYAAAQAIYQALLPPLAEGEIYLGQDELVDEVLTWTPTPRNGSLSSAVRTSAFPRFSASSRTLLRCGARGSDRDERLATGARSSVELGFDGVEVERPVVQRLIQFRNSSNDASGSSRAGSSESRRAGRILRHVFRRFFDSTDPFELLSNLSNKTSKSCGDARNVVPLKRSITSGRSNNSFSAAAARTPRVPITRRSRRVASVRPSRSSINNPSAPNSSASKIASRSPAPR